MFNFTSVTGVLVGSGSGSGFGAGSVAFFSTVTLQLACLFPSSVVTVIIAVPSFLAVITPFSTVATSSLFELHVMFLFVAFSGITVAVRVSVSPSFIVVCSLFNFTSVTGVLVVSSVLSLSDAIIKYLIKFVSFPFQISSVL